MLLVLSGCAVIKVPSGQENTRTWNWETTVDYQDAYRIVAKQMRACYRVIGFFGNGYDIQADLDTSNRRGTVELYSVGLFGAEKPEDSIVSRTVTIIGTEKGSRITTTLVSKTLTHPFLTISCFINGLTLTATNTFD